MLPLKLICCIAAVLAGGYIGFARGNRYKRRIKELELCQVMFLRLNTFLKASNLPTGELFKRLSEQTSLNELGFIGNTAKRLEENPDFPTVWREELTDAKSYLALKNEDYIPLLSLCELIGSCNSDGLLSQSELAIAILKQNEKAAREENDTKGKLARNIGLLSGIAVAILII